MHRQELSIRAQATRRLHLQHFIKPSVTSEPVQVTETKRYGNCHGVKKEGSRDAEVGRGVEGEEMRDGNWNCGSVVTNDQDISVPMHALMNGALSGR